MCDVLWLFGLRVNERERVIGRIVYARVNEGESRLVDLRCT